MRRDFDIERLFAVGGLMQVEELPSLRVLQRSSLSGVVHAQLAVTDVRVRH